MKKWMVVALTAALCITGSAFAEEATVVETEKFSVSVPADVLEICDVEEEGGGISFYEKIAHESFGGGFVGRIALYENVGDYGNMPSYTRGGEIDYPDGSKLDIVLEYPSDVQTDLDNEDSINNYQKLGEDFKAIAAEIVPSGDGTFVPQDQIDTTGIYADILQKLADDLTERKDRDGLEEDGFSYVYAYSYDLEDKDPLDEIGFAYTDINGDGYVELVIGSVGDSIIYDMYAPVDGEPVHIFSGGERNTYALYGHPQGGFYEICNEASGGAAIHETTFYYLGSNEPEMLQQTRFLYDAEKDEENPWFADYGIAEEEPEPLTEEDWNQRISNFGEKKDPGFVALSSR